MVNRLDARIRQYYYSFLDDVPWELVAVLRRGFGAQHLPRVELKIDRVRAGGPPHVRMPSPESSSNHWRLAHHRVPRRPHVKPSPVCDLISRRALVRASTTKSRPVVSRAANAAS